MGRNEGCEFIISTTITKRSKNNKILLVDDEPVITSLFRMGLEDSGFTVDAFNDPLFALETFKRKAEEKSSSYVLAVLDIKMPGMNGFELFNEIRAVNDKIKVCFITAFDLQKEMKDLKTSSLSEEKLPAVIQKPISIDDFVAMIRAHMPLESIAEAYPKQQIHFLICETCFWCASLLSQIPDHRTILNWHSCENKIIYSYLLA